MNLRDAVVGSIGWGDAVEPPSRNRSAYWIRIEGPGDKGEPPPPDIQFVRRGDMIGVLRLSQDGEIESKTEYPLTEENIDVIAKKHNILSGKWLIFEPSDKIDRTWEIIADAVETGELGSAAKVATAINKPNKDKRVICVYTADYFNKEEVMQVREKLRELGIEERIYYKPDIYTYLNIYSRNVSFGASRYSA